MQVETDYGDLDTIMKNLDIIKRKQSLELNIGLE